MTTKEFRDKALDNNTWFIHWEVWQAAHEMGLERRQTTLGYSLYQQLDGDDVPVFQGLVDGLRLPFRYMWPHGIPPDMTDQYRRQVENLVPLTDAEKEPFGRFPEDFDQYDVNALIEGLQEIVENIEETTEAE